MFHIRYLSDETDLTYYIKFVQGKGEVCLDGTMLIFSGQLPSAIPFAKPKPLTIPIADISNVSANGTRIKIQYRKENKVKNLFFTTTKEDADAIIAALPNAMVDSPKQTIETMQPSRTDQKESIKRVLQIRKWEGFCMESSLSLFCGIPAYLGESLVTYMEEVVMHKC